ncbi:unnamed protein product [Brassica rapa]|uniref:Uncharacterized protein n=1 Tax=Brassica campestris TaxID=3711 RepID=A0A3P6AZ97_BRACM|nr:unnamed protein product [Brassica rapa]VDC82170.1 unnamed protein product [Brassica rapa]VDC95135.1 unnamed protein product [Brassica rapa]VDD16793.1 unnamed protein product [Brassica rapa]
MIILADSRHQRNKRPHYHPLNPNKSGGGTHKKVISYQILSSLESDFIKLTLLFSFLDST